MDLLQLKYFYESAQNGSFSKTAQKYMVPLSSVSASIRRLEQELNCQLFDRFPNYVALNDNGRELQKSLCVAFAEIDVAIGKITSQTTGNREIKILVRSMRRKIADWIVAFNRMFPYCTFKISFDFDETAFDAYDIIIDEESDRYAEYRKFELFTSRLRIKCAKNHPMLGKKITMKQLADATFLSMGEKSNLHQLLIDRCKQAGFTPKIHIFCNDLECYEKLIAGNLGIAIGIETTQNPDIEFLDVSDFDERYTIYCYFQDANPSSDAEITKKFVDFLSNAGNGMPSNEAMQSPSAASRPSVASNR